MKFQFSLPKDEQFFNNYAALTPTLRALGIMAQVVSAATEVGVIFSIVRASLADFLPQYSTAAAVAGAIAATLFLEAGLRQLLPHAARAVLNKQFGGLHLPMTLFIWATCAVLLFASGGLSFRGSREMVAAIAPAPTLADDAAHMAAYRQDSAATTERYGGQFTAIAARSRAEVTQQRQALARLQAKERAEDRHYTTAKAAIREKIAAIEATAAAELATLATARADDLATAQKRLHAGRDQVDDDNAQAKASAATKVNNYGLGLGWFSLLALFVLITAVALEEIARKGAGITATAQPNQWHFSQGIAAELMTAINGIWQHYARALIRRITEATPTPPPPEEAPELYDVPAQAIRRKGASHAQAQAPAQPGKTVAACVASGMASSAVRLANGNIRYSHSGAPADYVTLTPGQAMQVVEGLHSEAAKAAKAGDSASAQRLIAEAEKIAQLLGERANPYQTLFETNGHPSGNGHHPQNSADGMSNTKEKVLSTIDKPFIEPTPHNTPTAPPAPATSCMAATAPRRQIGYKTPDTNGMRYNALRYRLADCPQCGQQFEAKTTWHTYCSEDCRLAFHAARHGQPFNPEQYRKNKKRKA